MPIATPEPQPTPGRRGPGRVLRTPLGAGVLVLVVLAVLLAAGGLLSGAGQPAANVAAASPSALAVASVALPSTTASAASTPPPSPSPQPSATSSPATASPPPSASPTGPPSPSSSPSPSATRAPSPGDGVPAKALQARLDKLRARLQVPGVSVAILWDDGRRWLGASGYRDVAARDPMTTGTAFALASISKTTTAAVVLELVGEGRLSLDDTVAAILPAFKVDPRVTIRQLLDHTSGLPDYFLNPKIDRPLQRHKNASWTAERTWTYVLPKRLRPGRTWSYSNTNYLLLGRVVEQITGHSLASEVRRRLFRPLGLDATWYQAQEKPLATGTLAYRVVAGSGGKVAYVPIAPASDVMPFRSVVTASGGAGSIAATAADAARWMQAFAGGEVLPPAMQKAMVGDVAKTRALRPRIPYGLGIQAVPIAGRYALGHSGRFIGFRNVVRYLPHEGITIAVLTNQGVRDPAKIAEPLLKLVLPPLPVPVPSAAP